MKKILFPCLLILAFQNVNTLNIKKLYTDHLVVKNTTNQTQKVISVLKNYCTTCKDQCRLKEIKYLKTSEKKIISTKSGLIEHVYPAGKRSYLLYDSTINNVGNDVHFFNIENKHRVDHLITLDFEEALEEEPRYKQRFNDDPTLTARLSKDLLPSQLISLTKEIYLKNNFSKLKNQHSSKLKIPLILHQIWIGSEMPKLYQKYRKKWRKQHSHWKYICWTEKTIKKHFPNGFYNQKMFDYAQKIKNYGRMSDVIRYEILFKYGGLYVDTDVRNFENFNFLHYNYDFYAGFEPFTFFTFVGNAIIGSTANNYLLNRIMQEINKNSKNYSSIKNLNQSPHGKKEGLKTFRETGPDCFTCILLKHLNKNEYHIILPRIYFYAKDFSSLRKGIANAHSSLCSHDFHGSWSWLD